MVLRNFVELRQGGHLGEELVQVGIVLERGLQQFAEVAEGVRDAGQKMGFLLKIAAETIGSQHLQGAE